MTLIVTHAAGFLACFTRNLDGTLKQRALIDTGEEPPTATELADIGERFAKQYGWVNGSSIPTPPVARVAKAKPARQLPPKRRYDNVSDPPVNERQGMILEFVRHHPRVSIAEIIEGCGFESTETRRGRWRFQIEDFVDSGVFIREDDPAGTRRTKHYSLANA